MRVESFPRITPSLSDEEKKKLPQAAQYADLWGCPSNLLHLCEPEYSDPESFKVHRFRDLQIRHLESDKLRTITVNDQIFSLKVVTDSLLKQKGKLFIINAHPDLREGMRLLWHILCLLAVEKAKEPFKHRFVGVSVAGNTRLQDAQYNVQNTLVIGPVLDEFGPERTVNLVDTIYRFEPLNRIILVSTSNLTEMLNRMRVAPEDVFAFFNVSAKDLTAPAKKKRATKTQSQEI